MGAKGDTGVKWVKFLRVYMNITMNSHYITPHFLQDMFDVSVKAFLFSITVFWELPNPSPTLLQSPVSPPLYHVGLQFC